MILKDKRVPCLLESKCVVEVDDSQVIVSMADKPPRTFAYDYVFGMDATQTQVYEASAFKLIESVA